MHSPTKIQLEAVYRILRYFKGSLGKKLFFKKNKVRRIKNFTHANWARSLEDRRLTIGYCTFVWENLVTWKSKKQNLVARISFEPEFQAVAYGICEGIWLKKVLEELKMGVNLPIKFFCEYKVAINISLHLVQHDWTKHVELNGHFIKKKSRRRSYLYDIIFPHKNK